MPGFPHSLLYHGGIERSSHVVPPSYLPVSGGLVPSAEPGWVYSTAQNTVYLVAIGIYRISLPSHCCDFVVVVQNV